MNQIVFIIWFFVMSIQDLIHIQETSSIESPCFAYGMATGEGFFFFDDRTKEQITFGIQIGDGSRFGYRVDVRSLLIGQKEISEIQQATTKLYEDEKGTSITQNVEALRLAKSNVTSSLLAAHALNGNRPIGEIVKPALGLSIQ